MITARINVSEIDKDKLYKGEKGVYLNVVFIETPESKYSDYMIVQEIPREEREAGKRGKILGNAKILAKKIGPMEGYDNEIGISATELLERDKNDLPF